MKKHPLYFTIHGHFYQPPRENPWTGVIENQPSARPFHDWNDRIASECYSPNAASRILSSTGKIADIVDEYDETTIEENLDVIWDDFLLDEALKEN